MNFRASTCSSEWDVALTHPQGDPGHSDVAEIMSTAAVPAYMRTQAKESGGTLRL